MEKLKDVGWLRKQYTTRSMQSIADELGVHRNTVRLAMNRLDIKRRSTADHFKGIPKTDDHRKKMSEARKKYWDAHPNRDAFRLKISKSKTIHGLRHGYKRVYTTQTGRILEHRLVMEQVLGRKLKPEEQIHHIDGNKLNNDPSNLQVMSNRDHQLLHDSKRHRNEKGQFID